MRRCLSEFTKERSDRRQCAIWGGFRRKGDLNMPPLRHIASLTCMDARLDPMAFAGLNLGEAHIIRNPSRRRATMLSARWLFLPRTAWQQPSFCHSPHQLRYGDFRRHHHARSSRQQSRYRAARCRRLERWRAWQRYGRGRLHRLADRVRQCGRRSSTMSPGFAVIRLCLDVIPIYGFVCDVANGRLVDVAAVRWPGKAA